MGKGTNTLRKPRPPVFGPVRPRDKNIFRNLKSCRTTVTRTPRTNVCVRCGGGGEWEKHPDDLLVYNAYLVRSAAQRSMARPGEYSLLERRPAKPVRGSLNLPRTRCRVAIKKKKKKKGRRAIGKSVDYCRRSIEFRTRPVL